MQKLRKHFYKEVLNLSVDPDTIDKWMTFHSHAYIKFLERFLDDLVKYTQHKEGCNPNILKNKSIQDVVDSDRDPFLVVGCTCGLQKKLDLF